jgi:hypothetical protein
MKKACTLLCATMLLAGTAAANDLAFGPRIGYTHDSNLDQFHFGAHMVVQHLTTNLHVIPSLEVGVGDGTLLAVNGDLVYEFTELASGKWSFYAGGGPVLTHYTRSGFDSTDFALNLVAGTTFDVGATKELLGEVRIGLEDAPNLKLTLGLTFF